MRVLAAVSVGQFLIVGGRMVVPALLPTIRESFGFSVGLAGALITFIGIIYALTHLLSGPLAQRSGERWVLAIGLIVTLTATLILSQAWTVLLVFLGAALVNAGTALFGAIRVTVLADTFEDDAGAQGIMSAAGNVGAVVLPAAAGMIAAVYGWMAGLYWLIPLYFVGIIVLWSWIPTRTSPVDRSGLTDRSQKALRSILNPGVRDGVIMMILVEFTFTAITGLYPTYLTAVKGLPQQEVSIVYATFFLAAVLYQTSIDYLKSSFDEHTIILTFLGISAIGLLLLPFVDGLVGLIGTTVLLHGFSVFWPLEQSRIVGLLPDTIEGDAFGLIRTIYLLVGSISGIALGELAERSMFALGFQLLALMLCAAGIMVWYRYQIQTPSYDSE